LSKRGKTEFSIGLSTMEAKKFPEPRRGRISDFVHVREN